MLLSILVVKDSPNFDLFAYHPITLLRHDKAFIAVTYVVLSDEAFRLLLCFFFVRRVLGKAFVSYPCLSTGVKASSF